jgi:hypothetical protein
VNVLLQTVYVRLKSWLQAVYVRLKLIVSTMSVISVAEDRGLDQD